MVQLRLGIGLKIFSLLSASLLLSGCYKIEIRETLSLDGTSDIAVKMDISGMINVVDDMAQGLTESLVEGFSNLEPSSLDPVEEDFYTSCNDPKLLEKYGATKLDEPQNLSRELAVKKVTRCEVGDEVGFISITTDHINTANQALLFSDTVSRKAETCSDPAILAFYQIGSFDAPITEDYLLKEQVETSCSETETEITFSTVTLLGEEGDPTPLTEIFPKKPLAPLPQTTEPIPFTDTAENTDDSPEEGFAEMNFCEESEQDPTQMPFFFNKCEDLAPGVGAFHFSKYDTTGLTINSNGTVTYNLEPSTSPIQSDFNSELKDSGDDSLPMDINPAAMGFIMDYVLVSPWPILDYSYGTLEDKYTLRIDLLKNQASTKEGLTVTLDTDGATLNLLAPHIQNQIDQLIKSLQTKLQASDSPLDRQVEYIFYLSNKIQRLAAVRPDQQVPLGYLQTKLIQLAQELQRAPLENLEDEFLSELELLSEESWETSDEDFDTPQAEAAPSTSAKSTQNSSTVSENLTTQTKNTEPAEETTTETNHTTAEGAPSEGTDLEDEENLDEEVEDDALDEPSNEAFLEQ